jgi:hypothetical protein
MKIVGWLLLNNGRYHIRPDQPPRHLTPGRDTLATYQ